MNLDELENNRQDDQYFQDDTTTNEGQNIESPSVDHSITEYAEPDYGNDLSTEEINNSQNSDEFDEEDDDLFETEDSDDLDTDDGLDEDSDDVLEHLDEDDETFTDPDRHQ